MKKRMTPREKIKSEIFDVLRSIRQDIPQEKTMDYIIEMDTKLKKNGHVVTTTDIMEKRKNKRDLEIRFITPDKQEVCRYISRMTLDAAETLRVTVRDNMYMGFEPAWFGVNRI